MGKAAPPVSVPLWGVGGGGGGREGGERGGGGGRRGGGGGGGGGGGVAVHITPSLPSSIRPPFVPMVATPEGRLATTDVLDHPASCGVAQAHTNTHRCRIYEHEILDSANELV